MTRYTLLLPILCLSAGVLQIHAATPLPEPPALRVRPQTIDDQIGIGYGLAVADVDGDGKDDILLADQHEIVWYHNPSWQKYRITGALTPEDHVCIAARDIDGDGRAEVAVGAGWNPGDTENSGAVFYLMPPEDRTGMWEPIRLPHEPTVHRMHWIRMQDGTYSLVVLPLHGRGNKNTEGAGVRVLAYRPPVNPHDTWETFLLNDTLHLTHNFDPTAWEANATREGILLASKEGLMRMEGSDSGWRTRQLTARGAGETRSGKLPGGNRFLTSIEPFHGNEAVVYTTSGQDFERAVLDNTLIQGHALATGDLLGTGWDQVVVGWRGPIPTRPGVKVGIKLFAPTDRDGSTWKLHALVDDDTMACEDLKLADLNGDGMLDIVACGRASKNVIIYWNETGAN
ncbi:MAG: hypothetical protein RI897_60 [Verrucomicrobiota bacterium]|jgi:hypothetical protein